ncbi:MAG: glycosyltransferase family 4 protein [Chloroflexi bacterium]|nr:glycosyltransferase family 4 protein [Chloroflexota bacterium]
MKVLYLHQSLLPFVERDMGILRETHEVRELHFRGLRDLPLLWAGVRWADVVYTWFASLHAFFGVLFARRLGKKSVVVAGGWDVGRMPTGMLYDWRKAWCPRYVVSHADLTLFVSRANQEEALAKLGSQVKRWEMVYHGFEGDRFAPMAGVGREPSVLMVSGVSWYYFHHKRLDLLLEVARRLPDLRFSLAGAWIDQTIKRLRREAPPNVEFLGYVPNEELPRLYSKAAVYFQPSSWESFGAALAEAMLCECVPVVSRAGSLPEVVGECGIYAEQTADSLAAAIQEALRHPELGHAARRRILKEFPFEARRDRVLELVRKVSDGSL